MPLGPDEVDVEARKQAGRDAAIADKAKKHKPVGQTSEKNYPFTDRKSVV